MCIATATVGGIIAGITAAITAATEAVTSAVVAVGTSVGTALGSVGSFLGIGGGASAAGASAAGAGAGGLTGAAGMSTAAEAAQAVTMATLIPTDLGIATYGAIPGAVPIGSTMVSVAPIGVTAAASSVPWGTIGSVGLTALGAGASVAGSVLGTVANMQNNQMQSDMAAYLAAREEVNGVLAARQGEHIDLQANQDRLQLRNKMMQTQGDARASFAARGVVLGSGTPNDYEADIADAYDLDSRNLEYDVAMKKWKYQVEAANHFAQAGIYRNQSSAYQSAKSASLLGGMFGTAGSAMSGIASGLSVSSKLGWI